MSVVDKVLLKKNYTHLTPSDLALAVWSLMMLVNAFVFIGGSRP